MTKQAYITNSKKFAITFVALLVAAILLTIFLSVKHLHAHEQANVPKIYDCKILGETKFVYIKDNRFYPRDIEAKACDVITVINQDEYRLIAFGQHSDHIEYNGLYEEQLKKDASITFTLNQTGNYIMHDHLEDYVYATFSVEDLEI